MTDDLSTDDQARMRRVFREINRANKAIDAFVAELSAVIIRLSGMDDPEKRTKMVKANILAVEAMLIHRIERLIADAKDRPT
jgi:hypothetical protein